MANLKSSKKAIKTSSKKSIQNNELKKRVINIIKNLEKVILNNDKEKASLLLKDFQKYADRAVAKGLMKKNTVNRQKSRLNDKVKNMK